MDPAGTGSRPAPDRLSVPGDAAATENKFRDLANSLPQTIFEVDLQGNLTFVNRSGYDMWEATDEDVEAGINIFDWLVPECHQAAVANMMQVMRGGPSGHEYVARTKHGRRFPIVVHSRPIVRNGQPVGLRGIVVDITAQKAAEAARLSSESRFRSLVKNAVFGIYRSTLDGRFVEVNPALVSMLGYASEEELLSVPVLALYRDPRDRRTLLDRFRYSESVRGVEAEWKRKDGKPIVVRLNGRWVCDEGLPEGFEMIVEDVSDRRTLENQLHQAQKMEAVGRLAGGVAHDFNNLLTAILGYAELLAQQVRSEETSRDVAEISRAAERASALTRQLLAFSRKQVLQPKAIDLNTVVSSIAPMLRRLIGEDVQLSIQLQDALSHIKADPGQMEQVIMNLAVNARDAMPHGGTLAIETAEFELDETSAGQAGSMTPGRYVMLSVADSGCGMTEDVKGHLFEPFFTTKEHGKGTGLGLATVYGIVRQSSGHICVYSEPGVGATFKIYFPCVAGASEHATSGQAQAEEPARGSETILLVEDDEAVRRLAREMLMRHGYRVLQADSGEAAVALAAQQTGLIDLVVTDVVMPRMSGRDLADRLKAIGSNVPVVYMSGYADHAIVANAPLPSGAAFLQKPFTRHELLTQVRAALDTRAKG